MWSVYLAGLGYTEMSIMGNTLEWSIVFYVDESGRSPVREFLEGLDRKTQVRFAWSIEQLRVRSLHAREPLVRHLEGDIWELREESSTNIFRLLYVFVGGRRIVILHGFRKRTQKTPRREIDVAERRLAQFLVRQKGE
jgi:phage-related protein